MTDRPPSRGPWIERGATFAPPCAPPLMRGAPPLLLRGDAWGAFRIAFPAPPDERGAADCDGAALRGAAFPPPRLPPPPPRFPPPPPRLPPPSPLSATSLMRPDSSAAFTSIYDAPTVAAAMA